MDSEKKIQNPFFTEKKDKKPEIQESQSMDIEAEERKISPEYVLELMMSNPEMFDGVYLNKIILDEVQKNLFPEEKN